MPEKPAAYRAARALDELEGIALGMEGEGHEKQAALHAIDALRELLYEVKDKPC